MVKSLGGKIITYFYNNKEKKEKKTCSHFFCLPEITLESPYELKNHDDDDDDDKHYPQIFLE